LLDFQIMDGLGPVLLEVVGDVTSLGLIHDLIEVGGCLGGELAFPVV